MSIICALFGHKSLEHDGWRGSVGYAQITGSNEDGIERVHLYLEAKCPRCGVTYRICNAHLPKEYQRG